MLANENDGMMSAIALTEYGAETVLKMHRVKKPVIRPGDVLVKNIAAALNPVDYKVRQSGMGHNSNFDAFNGARILGWDAAGVVEEVGPDAVGKFRVGDEVYYMGHLNRNGSNAEYTAVDHRQLALKPKNLTFAEAATAPLVGQTAHNCIYEQMKCEPGKTILVYNGAGGLGSFAVQLAKAKGCKVIATASRPETRAMCEEMGADHIINHREPLKPQLKALGIEGVNYVFNCYGPQLTGKLMPLLLCDGQIANIDPPLIKNFEEAKDELLNFWLKRCTLVATFVFARSEQNFEVEEDARQLQFLAKLFEEGKLKPTMKRKYKLQDIQEAHKFQVSGKSIGKIALTIVHDQADLKTLKPPTEDGIAAQIAGTCTIL